ncbi:MAG: DciA family protein [Hyphococcus sp.]
MKTRPARRGPPKLSRASAAVFSALVRKTKYADPALAENWPAIAGAAIAARCRPGRVTGGRAGRTLEVFVPSGAAAAELQMRADDLLARVNRYLGPGAVARIAIRQVASAKQKPPAQGETSSDLGRALASFRAAVSNRDDEPGGAS